MGPMSKATTLEHHFYFSSFQSHLKFMDFFMAHVYGRLVFNWKFRIFHRALKNFSSFREESFLLS